MVIPKDASKIGIVMEFKKVDRDEEEDLRKAGEEALKQIAEKQYRQELIARGIRDIVEVGIAFEGKNVMVLRR